MKVLKFNKGTKSIQIYESLTIEVNGIITADAMLSANLSSITSEMFGEVTVLEDSEVDLIFYINGEETNYKGFKTFYNQLFKKDFYKLLDELTRFTEKQVLLRYPNSIESLSTEEKIHLLLETIEKMPRFASDCDKMIVYNTIRFNEVLLSLGAKPLPFKKYKMQEDDKASFGIDLRECYDLYKKIKKENK